MKLKISVTCMECRKPIPAMTEMHQELRNQGSRPYLHQVCLECKAKNDKGAK